MKNVTTDFRNLQARHNYKPYKTIECYRRVWNGATREYHWETTSLDLLTYLDRVTSLNWALDTEGLNKWRLSNITITLKNTNKEFNEDTVGGLLDGYTLFQTKIKIKVGYKKDDGTYDTIYVFNGVVAKEPTYDYVNKKVSLNVSGLEIFTNTSDAEALSVEVIDEPIGTGAGATAQAFPLDNNGVGKITNVKVAGVEQIENIDYKVTDLNIYNRPAKINMVPDAPNGLAVTCSYRYWYQDKTIQWLVAQLLNLSGFDSNNTEISNAIFYSGERRNIWNTQAEFEVSTRSRNIDTNTQTGDIMQATEDFNAMTLSGLAVSGGELINPSWTAKYECNDLPESATPAWTRTIESTYSFTTRQITSSQFYCHKNKGTDDVLIFAHETYSRAVACSTLAVRCKCYSTDYDYAEDPLQGPSVHIGLAVYNGVKYKTAYINFDGGNNRQYVQMSNEGGGGGGTYELGDNEYHDYWLYIANDGTAYLYVDGTLRITATAGNSAETKVLFDLSALEWVWTAVSNFDADFYFDSVYYATAGFSPTTGSGTGTSTAIDFGSIPIYYGKIYKGETLNGGTTVYETQSSGTVDFTLDNDSWRTVTWDGNVGTISAGTVMKRYLRWRVTITMSGGGDTPEISEVTMPASILFDTLDLISDLYTYGNFDVWDTLSGQEIKSYSSPSSDALIFDAEQEVVSEVVASSIKRYIKFRNIISKITAGTKAVIHRERFLWNIQSFNVQMANFSDMSVQHAIENLAFLVNYEIGITATGKHFFRSKIASSEVDWAFDEDTDIIEVTSVRPLWEKIYNKIIIEYGDYSENSDALVDAEGRPNTIEKYGKKFLRLGGTNMFIDPAINIAKGMVQTYYEEYKNKGEKKEVSFKAKAIFQLDLGDTITINRDDLTGKTFKVVGITLDIENWEMQVVAWQN